MKPKFIVFEGTDGSGKSTLLEQVRAHLAAKRAAAEFVCDPGGTEIGSQIRQILLATRNSGMSALTELLLYSASRAQLVEEKIRPALASGRHVLSDRYIYSTLSYQGVNATIAVDTLESVVQAGCGGLVPDQVFLLDLPAEIGLNRTGRARDRMEMKGIEYLECVRQRYLQVVSALGPERATIVDATQPAELVAQEVIAKIDRLLGL